MNARDLDLFDHYREPVAAARKGKIIYMNHSGRKLFGKELIGGEVDRIIPGWLVADYSAPAICSFALNGQMLRASLFTSGEYLMISVLSTDPEEGRPRELMELIGSVSSMAKSSLATHQLALDYLRGKIGTEGDVTLAKYMAILDHSHYKVLRVMNNLSKLCGAVRGANEMNPVCFDLVKLCTDLVGTVGYLAKERGIELRCESEEDSMTFCGDPRQIESILLNLLSNSYKYTAPGGSVTVTVRRLGDGAILRVSDTGCGIPPEVLDTVFERYKYPRRLEDAMEGIGLGLGIVSDITNRHGGSVVIDSHGDGGTTVTVALGQLGTAGNLLRDPSTAFAGDMTRVLIEMSDVLDRGQYIDKYIE